MQRTFALDDAALDVALRIRTRVALDDVHALDDHAVADRQHLEDATLLAFVLAGRHDDRVVPANRCLKSRHDYSTSGASEMIFMNRRSRSSRATGPNTRVPIGSLLSFTSTAALRSNRM